MDHRKTYRATTIVLIGILGLITIWSQGCGGYVGGGGNKGYSIAGSVVDSATNKPVAGAQVALEQPDGNGIDRIISSTTTASDGTFSFNPSAGNYDVVVDAVVAPTSGPTVTYAATVAFGVPANASLNQIPLVPEFGTATPNGIPATIVGKVSSTGINTMAFNNKVDVMLSALQSVSPAVGTVTQITIPAFAPSTTSVTTASDTFCMTGTTCANYTLLVPEGDFSAGRFSTSGTQYTLSAQQNTQVSFVVEGRAFVYLAGLSPTCMPSITSSGITVSSGTLSFGNPNLAFIGCP